MAVNISLNWLKDYLDKPELLNSDEAIKLITQKLPFIGYEVDGVHKINNNFDKLVVGKVIERVAHENSDHLSVCKVIVEQNQEPLQIVCGAPNVRAGQTVCVALVGASFGDFVIKKSKIRGVESFGMICSEQELGLSNNHDGIMVLDESLPAGKPIKELFGYEDTVLELDITANRPDMFGHFGFAREFSLIMDTQSKFPAVEIRENNQNIKDFITVDIQDKGGVRYCARMIKNVKVKESPKWLKDRLMAVGLRPINNIVDITNFVMLETGHPLHAFDYKNIAGQKIIVRKAVNGEKFTTLDSVTHELNDEILLICDAEKPVAIAGVMGGLNSGVTESTVDVLLEVAAFNFVDIRHATKHLRLSTDSAKRFERGVDPNDSEFVINRTAALILELAGGEVVGSIYDAYPTKIDPLKINLRYKRVNQILGFEIEPETVRNSLEKIGLTNIIVDDSSIEVTVPTRRPDITREVDLIEEVIRVYGYENLPEITRSNINLEISSDPEEMMLDQIRRDLAGLGLYEISTHSMIDLKYCRSFPRKPIKIQYPLNEEMNHLRTSLLSSMLKVTSSNIRRKNEKINIFETGKIFELLEDGKFYEQNSIAVVLSGKLWHQQWNRAESLYDFYDIKGLTEAFLQKNNYHNITFSTDNILSYFDQDEAMAIYCDGNYLGTMGRVNPDICKEFEIDAPVFALEIDLNNLTKANESQLVKLTELSKYPKVLKDLSFLLNDELTAAEIISSIQKYGGKNLQNVEVIDFYKGKQVEDGKKSYSFRLTFQSISATLSDVEIEKLFQKVINGVIRDFQVQLR